MTGFHPKDTSRGASAAFMGFVKSVAGAQLQGSAPWGGSGSWGGGGGQSWGGGGGGGMPQRCTLFIWKLKEGATEDELYALFTQAVTGFMKMKYQAPEGDRWGQCWAQFLTPQDAVNARETLKTYGLPSNPDEALSVDFAKNDLDVPGGCPGGKGALTDKGGKGGAAAFGTAPYGKGDYGKGGYGKGCDSYGKGGDSYAPSFDKGDKGKAGGKGPKGKDTGYNAYQMATDLVDSGQLPGGKWRNDENTIYIDGLPPDTTDRELYVIFSPFGAILPGGASLAYRPDGTPMGHGFVNFAEPNGAALACQALNECQLPDGKQLRVKPFGAGDGMERLLGIAGR